MALWGEPGAMIDGIHLPLMIFTCNNNYKHNTLYILSVQATVWLHEQVKKFVPICHESWDIAKQYRSHRLDFHSV